MRCIERLSAAGGRVSAVARIGRSLWPAPGGRAYAGPDCPVREAEEQGAWGSGAEAAGTGPPFGSSAQQARVRMRTAPSPHISITRFFRYLGPDRAKKAAQGEAMLSQDACPRRGDQCVHPSTTAQAQGLRATRIRERTGTGGIMKHLKINRITHDQTMQLPRPRRLGAAPSCCQSARHAKSVERLPLVGPGYKFFHSFYGFSL